MIKFNTITTPCTEFTYQVSTLIGKNIFITIHGLTDSLPDVAWPAERIYFGRNVRQLILIVMELSDQITRSFLIDQLELEHETIAALKVSVNVTSA